ncbi:hypothetical protein ON010_g3679 [Phytophthora cinnamomi]|nr:hypothetical protein ON010_g3679 [Phytophthora cinnamomi]
MRARRVTAPGAAVYAARFPFYDGKRLSNENANGTYGSRSLQHLHLISQVIDVHFRLRSWVGATFCSWLLPRSSLAATSFQPLRTRTRPSYPRNAIKLIEAAEVTTATKRILRGDKMTDDTDDVPM